MDPAWDPAARQRVLSELNELLVTMRRLLDANAAGGRHGDTFYEPDEIASGDISGISGYAMTRLVEPLDRQVAAARAAITKAVNDAEDYKRQVYGPAYQP